MLKDILANVVGRLWSILSAFIFIPFYIRLLGFESYSIISFTLVIAGIMAILDVGLSANLLREFARKDKTLNDKIRVFKTLESSFLILVIFSILILLFLSDVIANKWLILNSYNPNNVSFFLKVISFEIGFQLLFRFYIGGLMGLDLQVKANIFQIVWGFFRNAVVFIPIFFIKSLDMFFIWQTVSTIIFTFLLRLSLNKEIYGQYKFNFKATIEKSVFKDIWPFARGMLLISIVASLNTQMDKLAITKLLSIETLGYYTLAVSLAMTILIGVNPIAIALLPKFTALYSSGKIVEASVLFTRVNTYISIIVFSIMANMSYFSKEIIWIWTNNIELANNAYIYLPILTMSAAMLSLAVIPYNIALANGFTKYNNILGIISLFATLPGYWLATKLYGALGAATVYCIVQLTITLIYNYLINKKYIHIKGIYTMYFKQLILPLVISLIIAFSFSFKPNWIIQDRFYTLIWIGLSLGVTLLINVLFLIPLSDIYKVLNFRKLSTKT